MMKLNTDEFIKTVQEMRSAQKIYFRNRVPFALENAKKLERRVDGILETYESLKNQGELR